MTNTTVMAALVLVGTTIPAGCSPSGPTGGPATGDPPGTAAPLIDGRAAEAFFEVAESLLADREPDSRVWKTLVESPAAAVLEAEGLPGAALAEAYSVALSPSRAEERSMLDRSTSLGRMVSHVEATAARRDELRPFLDGLDARGLGIDVDRLARFVPPSWRDTRPTVALAVFGPDMREGDVFVIDLALAKDTDLGPFLGHESFQWYRRRHRVVDPASADPADADLMWALDRLQARGIGNQIDKAPLIDGTTVVRDSERLQVERFRRAVSQSPELIRLLDRLLAIASDPTRRADAGAEIRRMLPQGGHPTGFYMATVILEHGKGEELAATGGDPFAFVELYNEAAGRPGGVAPAFSPEAMQAVRELRKRYATTPPADRGPDSPRATDEHVAQSSSRG